MKKSAKELSQRGEKTYKNSIASFLTVSQQGSKTVAFCHKKSETGGMHVEVALWTSFYRKIKINVFSILFSPMLRMFKVVPGIPGAGERVF